MAASAVARAPVTSCCDALLRRAFQLHGWLALLQLSYGGCEATAGSAVPRRTTVVNVNYAVLEVAGSNLGQVGPSSTNIEVRAGVVYNVFEIRAEGGLGSDRARVRAKLVPYDLRATLQSCESYTEYMGQPLQAPLDGSSEPSSASIDYVHFINVVFPFGGEFRLCYCSDCDTSNMAWEELPPRITAYGAFPEQAGLPIWCAKTNLDNGADCSGKVTGQGLGQPPQFTTSRATLKGIAEDCIDNSVPTPAATVDPSPFGLEISAVSYYEGYEVHNFTTRSGGTVGRWKVCYCVGFNQDNTDTDCSDTKLDFPQEIGQVISIDVKTMSGTDEVTVFPTLPFNLKVECSGGCSGIADARYKLIRRSVTADRPYFDGTAGCQFLEQAALETDGAKIHGGHIGPLVESATGANCLGATECYHQPDEQSATFPTWYSVQLGASYENSVLVPAEYDICYCDQNCLNSAYWFKAGVIQVYDVTVRVITVGLATTPTPSVNINYYLQVSNAAAGSWSTAGKNTREMKILSDSGGQVNSESCLDETQPNAVSGHRLENGNTDYTEPQTLFRSDGRPYCQQYGAVCSETDTTNCDPNIKISVAGWYAVCYCDSNCNSETNWLVAGRTLIAGPFKNQEWVKYTGVTFDLTVLGWGLASTNRLRIISYEFPESDCGSLRPSPEQVHGPTRAISGDPGQPYILNEVTAGATITGMAWHEGGTELTFSTLHGLQDGDYIKLEGFASCPEPTINDMYNSWHEVFVVCDDATTGCYSIVVPVHFLAAEFPSECLGGGVKWSRSSEELFREIRIDHGYESLDGKGYVVCWLAEVNASNPDVPYVGQVGTIIAKNPLEMPEGYIGLTTIQPDVGAQVLLSFTTGDISTYADSTKQMKLVIQVVPERVGDAYQRLMAPVFRHTDQQDTELTESGTSQAFCGQVFEELWSEHQDGFPMPESCYFRLDKSSENIARGEQDDNRYVREIHMIFGRGNHLVKNTKYMIVLNMMVFSSLKDTSEPVFIYAMDDIETNPDSVIEVAILRVSPTKRVPPRDDEGNLLLSGINADDPRLDETDGVKIVTDNVSSPLKTLVSYCIAHNSASASTTPASEVACQPCQTEADCGNPDTSLYTWCRSAMELQCPAIGNGRINVPSFQFEVLAQDGRPVKEQQYLRLFMRPLTEWNMGLACSAIVSRPGDAPVCQPEALIGGTQDVSTAFPFNTIKLRMPINMTSITHLSSGLFTIGALSVPAGGFFPQVVPAEIVSSSESAPYYYRGHLGWRLYKPPKVLSTSLVIAVDPLVNPKPFRGDSDNKLYIRIVFGATLYAHTGNSVDLDIVFPEGYQCQSGQLEVSDVPDLQLFNGKFPSAKGRLGTPNADPSELNTANQVLSCRISFVAAGLTLYAGTPVFFELTVDNPVAALKSDATANTWYLQVTKHLETDGQSNLNTIIAGPYLFEGVQRRACVFSSGGTAVPALCEEALGSDYGGSVSVLGKLSEVIISPSNFGAGELNTLSVFFMTEQTVGTPDATECEIWVDAPSTFNFGQYCSTTQLTEFYYVPEGKGTTRLPVSSDIICLGALTADGELTYNRAKIQTTGRLLLNTLYGFTVKVYNTPYYVFSQLDAWRVWTYTASGSAVDGTDTSPRFNEQEDAEGTGKSWGIYELYMPSSALGVSIASLLPVGTATDITFLPIIPQVTNMRKLRVTAPSGYVWDFLESEFRYKAAALGVDASLVVEGVEADCPLGFPPACPQTAPLNVIAMESIQANWNAGVKYGFAAKIRVPAIPPTGSVNQFVLEFGFDETTHENRAEAGVVEGFLVQALLNGGVVVQNGIRGSPTFITFSVQIITDIPEGGGLVITGPPSFTFQSPICQPKPVEGFPELPYDTTCLYVELLETAQPQVSIVAGFSGIPAEYYSFSLSATNPPLVVSEAEAGQWVLQTYSLISEEIPLDLNTTINSFVIGSEMPEARLVMHPKEDCAFEPDYLLLEVPLTMCDFEHWQFHPPRGSRDDRPGASTQLIFMFKLATQPVGDQTMIVRAPLGYIFDTECSVETQSYKIFDITETSTLQEQPAFITPATPWTTTELSWALRYQEWPTAAQGVTCSGVGNKARLTIPEGLEAGGQGYLFRLSVLENPTTTPDWNYFVLEYNAESSIPFPGVEIWSFTNGSIQYRTSAASTNDLPITNLVTIQLRPVNDLRHGGHLLVIAPTGFRIPTSCKASVQIHPDEGLDTAGLTDTDLLWAQFNDGDVVCTGDTTPSNRGKLLFTRNDKYLHKQYLYMFELEVLNPESASEEAKPWTFESYDDLTIDNLVDSVTVDGFVINDAIQEFAYVVPRSQNAHAEQIIEFNVSFTTKVDIGEELQLIAPVSFFFSNTGDSTCPQYLCKSTTLSNTQPTCGANTITWMLAQESVPAYSPIVFIAQVRNPGITPTENHFQMRRKASTGSTRSSRKIDGYRIIPELDSAVFTALGTGSRCQLERPVVASWLCQAVASYTKIQVIFTPVQDAAFVQIHGNVNGAPFVMTEASFQDGTPAVHARSATHIAAGLAMTSMTEVSCSIINVINPTEKGFSRWSLATFSTPTVFSSTPVAPCGASGECGEFPNAVDRRDETMDQEGHEVLGYINVLETSFISPIYLAEKAATITFELTLSYDLATYNILRLTRPPGYTFVENTLQVAATSLHMLELDEHGIDYWQYFGSLEWQFPEDYYMVVAAALTAGTSIAFTLGANLPAVPQTETHWFFRTYEVLPIIDYDGEILDASHVSYPWTGRDLHQTGTNDGAFNGFILVGQLPMVISASLQTPNARIQLSVQFDIGTSAVAAATLGGITINIEAPSGYAFETNCRINGYSYFSKCIGNGNIATLTAREQVLSGSGVQAELGVINPEVTPTYNKWIAKLFTDGATQYERYSETAGYSVVAMSVTYKGNNQLGESSIGFFSFTPVKSLTTTSLTIMVTPPVNAGYNVLCTGVKPMGFVLMPECVSGGVNEPLELRWSDVSVIANITYTFGVFVYNPGGEPAAAVNYWGIMLQDGGGQTFDANMRVDGLELKELPLRCNGLGWTTGAPQVLATVLIQLQVLYEIAAGYATRIAILAPERVMFNEDINTVRVVPVSIPLNEATHAEIAGDVLYLNLDETRAIAARTYNILFEVSNPGRYPRDNTWTVTIYRDIDVEFTHVLDGYIDGTVSSFDLVAALAGGAARNHGSASSCLWHALVATGLAVYCVGGLKGWL